MSNISRKYFNIFMKTSFSKILISAVSVIYECVYDRYFGPFFFISLYFVAEYILISIVFKRYL